MKKIFASFLIFVSSYTAALVDFNNVKTPYYAKVEVSDGVTPRVMDTYYDGISKVLVIGPPPPGVKGNMKIFGDMNTSEFFSWVDGDPKKTLFSMNQNSFAKSLGVDPDEVRKKGKMVGKETFLGEKCTLWKLELEADVLGKQVTQVIESCIAKDGIQLWGKENGKLRARTLELKRGPQNPSLFALPKNFGVIDMSNIFGGGKN